MAEAAKKHKVSEPTIYAWRKHFGQMEAADVKKLKALELENSRQKKLLAEAALDSMARTALGAGILSAEKLSEKSFYAWVRQTA